MIEKTAKVTNGKVLNYTVTKDGYKSVSGSKLITANTNLKINLVPETSPQDVYKLGDRLAGCSTFVCYFDATDPDKQVQQKYAVFVLDSPYRKSNSFYNQDVTSLVAYGDSTPALNAKESATYNTNYVLNTLGPWTWGNNGSTWAFTDARNAAIIKIGDNYYESQLPNLYELNQIWLNRAFLDTKDENFIAAKSLTNWNIDGTSTLVWSSTNRGKYTNSYGGLYAGWQETSSGGFTYSQMVYNQIGYGVIPIFEIPVN